MGREDPRIADRAREARLADEHRAIVASPEFERAPVMRRLLDFLVTQTLAGRGDELKAYTIAVDGLGRSPDFDAQTDSYPRVQIGRLRRLLDTIYAARDCQSGERLHIPTGTYRVDLVAYAPGSAVIEAPVEPIATPATAPRRSVPKLLTLLALLVTLAVLAVLAWNALRTTPRLVADAPIIEIARVDVIGGREAAYVGHELRALIADALARNWIVRVRDAQARGGGADLEEADYRLSLEADTMRGFEPPHVVLTLTDTRDHGRLWSGKTSLPPREASQSLQRTLRPMLSALTRPAGVIATHQRSLLTPADKRSGYGCMLEFEQYFRERDPTMSAAVVDCLGRTVAREPMSAPALAASSAIAFDPQAQNDPARGYEMARRAVAADPQSGKAWLADARAAIRAGQCARGRQAADRTVGLNPYDAEGIGLLGFLLASCRDPRAEMLIRDAIALDPDVPMFYRIALALVLIERGDVADAAAVGETTRPPGAGMAGQYALMRALIAGARGDRAAARREWAAVCRATGKAAQGPRVVLSTYIWPAPLRERVLARLGADGAL